MREIVFRGKRIDNGEWVKGSLLYDIENNLAYIAKHFEDKSAYLCEVIPKTVGQYTGLTDKNGKKIFEGDIVKNEYSKGKYQYFKVIYDDRIYCWRVENKYGMLGFLYNVIGGIEVIGNIHDNSELIKEV